jgi:hypothetical protein
MGKGLPMGTSRPPERHDRGGQQALYFSELIRTLAISTAKVRLVVCPYFQYEHDKQIG